MDGALRRAHATAPRRQLAFSGVGLLVILFVFGGATLAVLSQVGPGHSTFVLPWVRPEKWIPEIVLGASILLYALSAPALAYRLRSATGFQRLRALGILLMVCVFLLPGLRLVTSSLPVSGTLVLLAGLTISAAAQSRSVQETRSRLTEARKQGRLTEHLDEDRWTWKGADSYRVLVDASRHAPQDGGRWARRLHWLGPAAGIMAARFLAADATLLFTGGVTSVIALIASGTFFNELGLALQLAEWERQSGRQLTLVGP